MSSAGRGILWRAELGKSCLVVRDRWSKTHGHVGLPEGHRSASNVLRDPSRLRSPGQCANAAVP